MGSEQARRNKPSELRNLTADNLAERLETARVDLYKLRSDQGSTQLDNPMEIRTLRKLIARILTIQSETERSDTGQVT